MKVKQIIDVLTKSGHKVSKKEEYYNGSEYREKYHLLGGEDVDGKSAYLGIPMKVKSRGFITKKGVLENFFYFENGGFSKTNDINIFLENV